MWKLGYYWISGVWNVHIMQWKLENFEGKPWLKIPRIRTNLRNLFVKGQYFMSNGKFRWDRKYTSVSHSQKSKKKCQKPFLKGIVKKFLSSYFFICHLMELQCISIFLNSNQEWYKMYSWKVDGRVLLVIFS